MEMETIGVKGRLRIYFSYAPLSGAMKRMQEDADRERDRGRSIALGLENTVQNRGGRSYEVIPAREIEGSLEFDIDRALSMRPDVLILPGLQHANGQAIRHKKRYQDILELVENGFEVWTTLEVYALESLSYKVKDITGLEIAERIPDSVFDRATDVIFIDEEPDVLIRKSLAYLGDGRTRLLYTRENLTALRELALRRSAERVSRLEMKKPEYPEHVLVCLAPDRANADVVRHASRLAQAFHAEFTAVWIEPSDSELMKSSEREALLSNMKLATDLGAKTETVQGNDEASAVARFAEEFRVTKIVVGRRKGTRGLFGFNRNFVDRLSSLMDRTDIYMIPEEGEKSGRIGMRRSTGASRYASRDLLVTCLTFFCATVLNLIFDAKGYSEANIITVYIFSVLLNAFCTHGRIHTIILSLVSVFMYDFYFTLPRFALHPYEPGYSATLIIMFLSAFFTSGLASKAKNSVARSSENAWRTKLLLELSRILSKCSGPEETVEAAARQIGKMAGRSTARYLPDQSNALSEPLIIDEKGKEPATTGPGERKAAAWCYANGRRAGFGTETLGEARMLYIPVRTENSVYGVIGVMGDGKEPFSQIELSIMTSMAEECASCLEKMRIQKEKEENAERMRNEQLKANILRSISHDLRTPLASISGNANILISDGGRSIREEKKEEIYNSIYDDSMYLISLVENLLSVTRMEADTVDMRCQSEVVDEVIEEALGRTERRRGTHRLEFERNENLVLARMDVRLIVQVIINIVDNAVKYSPEGSTIRIWTRMEGEFVSINISDEGPGIPDPEKENVFNMFYSLHNSISDSRRSLGLGLFLCKSIIEAHGGAVRVTDNTPRGSVFSFTLPAEEVDISE